LAGAGTLEQSIDLRDLGIAPVEHPEMVGRPSAPLPRTMRMPTERSPTGVA
jgi:hypothetical protein